MSRRGTNIFKRKDGRWKGRYDDGRAKYSSVYARSYTECSCKLHEAEMKRLPVARNMTVNELFNAWILSKKNAVKVSTYVTYHNIYDCYVKDKIGGFKVCGINAISLIFLLMNF